MYQNNYFNPGMPQSAAGIPVAPRAKFTQPLSPEIISKLRSNADALKIEVSQDDLYRAACTHKENGNITLVSEGVGPNGGELVRCTICGKTFEVMESSDKEVEKITNDMISLLQTSKLMYLDAPAPLVQQYYQMLPLLEMFPLMYHRSQQNFDKYAMAQGMVPGQSVAGTNGFAMMNGMLQNPYGVAYGYNYGGYAPAQQMGGYQMPVAQQQPMMQPQYGMPQYPQYGQPQYGNPFMYNGAPQQPVAAPAPAPAAGTVPPAVPTADNGEVSQQKTFNV